jgi:hypothetical protein
MLPNEQFKVKFFHASVNLEKELLASDWDWISHVCSVIMYGNWNPSQKFQPQEKIVFLWGTI